MERIKRNRRFLGIMVINITILVFVAVHAPILVHVPYVPSRIYLRFAAMFVYSFVYAFVVLGANIKRTTPNRLKRRIVVPCGRTEH